MIFPNGVPDAILVEFKRRSGTRPRFVELVRANAASSLRDESGCRRFDLFVPEGSDDVMLYEEYSDQAAFGEHCRSAHFRLFDAEVASMILSKRVTVLDARNAPAIPKANAGTSAPQERKVAAKHLLALATDIFVRAGV